MKFVKYSNLKIFSAVAVGYVLLIAFKVQPLDAFIILFTGLVVFVFLRNLTKEINILDVTAMAACISYLLMPLITYNVFHEHQKLAALWRTFMVVSKEDYFYLALPGTVALVMGLWMPRFFKVEQSDAEIFNSVRSYLSNKKAIGVVLILVGLLAVPLINLVPVGLRALLYYASQLTYIGVFYLLYSKIQMRSIAIAFIISLMLAQSVYTGMYGELVYWSILGSIMFLVGNKRFTMFYRVSLLIVGVVFIFLLQSVKHDYRDVVWKGAERGNDPALFFSLFLERFQDPTSIFEEDRIYKLVVRANQGYLIARSMDHVPKHEPFANGETVYKSFASALVPRFLWANKPESGGRANICRFLGDCGKYNYSYNIGQLGEAYVNFGVKGAWLYMFMYGFMLSTLLNIVRLFSSKHPTLILWIPLLFYPAMVVESDLLTFINSFIKGVMFCMIFYFSIKLYLRINI